MLTPLLVALLWLFDTLISIYIFIIIAAVVMSWLVAFGVLNTYNQYARWLIRALRALTDPVFRQVHRIIPPLGGLDLSPMIVLLVLYFVRMVVDGYAVRAIYSTPS